MFHLTEKRYNGVYAFPTRRNYKELLPIQDEFENYNWI